MDFQKLKFGREASYSGKIYILLQEKEQKPYLPHIDDDHREVGEAQSKETESERKDILFASEIQICFKNSPQNRSLVRFYCL